MFVRSQKGKAAKTPIVPQAARHKYERKQQGRQARIARAWYGLGALGIRDVRAFAFVHRYLTCSSRAACLSALLLGPLLCCCRGRFLWVGATPTTFMASFGGPTPSEARVAILDRRISSAGVGVSGARLVWGWTAGGGGCFIQFFYTLALRSLVLAAFWLAGCGPACRFRRLVCWCLDAARLACYSVPRSKATYRDATTV